MVHELSSGQRVPCHPAWVEGKAGGWGEVEWICGWIGRQRLPVILSPPLPVSVLGNDAERAAQLRWGRELHARGWNPVVEDSTDARPGRGREVDLRKAEQCRWEPG